MQHNKNPIERTMFYGAKPIIFARARILRDKPTKAEKAMWIILRNKEMMGLRFKRQHPIDIFIADFYCHQIKLVIEVDGDIHNNEENKNYDKARTDELENLGISVIRFTNKKVIENIEEVKTIIEDICKRLMAK